MMEHMRSGMMAGMKQSMAGCPMMKKAPEGTGEGDPEEHSAHHPEG
jgi:hypothetical protein